MCQIPKCNTGVDSSASRSHQFVLPLIVTHSPLMAHLKLCVDPTLKVVTILELVLGDSRQLTLALEPVILQSMLPSRGQGIRHTDKNQSKILPSSKMALTTEEFVGIVTLVRKSNDLDPAVRRSLAVNKISSTGFNRRGQDGQRHASNDELDDLHIVSRVTYERENSVRVKMDYVGSES